MVCGSSTSATGNYIWSHCLALCHETCPIKKLYFYTSVYMYLPTTQYILWPFKPGLGNSDKHSWNITVMFTPSQLPLFALSTTDTVWKPFHWTFSQTVAETAAKLLCPQAELIHYLLFVGDSAVTVMLHLRSSCKLTGIFLLLQTAWKQGYRREQLEHTITLGICTRSRFQPSPCVPAIWIITHRSMESIHTHTIYLRA